MAELRVLRVLTRANLGGPARQCVALGDALAWLGVRELCAVGEVAPGETELDLPQCLTVGDVAALRTRASGFVRVAQMRRAVRPWADRASHASLLRAARAFAPHVVHTHTAKAGVLGSWVARRLGLPVVHTYHGHVLRDYFSGPVSAAFRLVERRLNARRAAVFCVSASCGRELEELGVVARGRWRVVPPAVAACPTVPEAARERWRAELGVDRETLLVAWCGRLVGVKRPELLVDVVARLSRRRPVRAVAFGTGPDADRQAARAKDLPLRFLGARPDFPQVVAAADVLLITSRREGLPVAAVEALAQRVPVVGPRVPGLVDLEGPGVTLAGDDSAALADACLAARPVPASAQRAVRARHEPVAVARRYLTAYASVTGRSPGPESTDGSAAELLGS